MYIIAIAWLYVVLMMAATEHGIVAALLTVLFYGVTPLALFLWIFGTPARRRAAARRLQPEEDGSVMSETVDEVVDQHDAADAQRNQ
jgi:hypothetical protein